MNAAIPGNPCYDGDLTVSIQVSTETTTKISTINVNVCTSDDQKKCGKNTCELDVVAPEGVVCTDPQDPTVTVCTEDQQAKCGPADCEVDGNGKLTRKCGGSTTTQPSITVCTSSEQRKCGSNKCSKKASNTAGVKCTDPSDPTIEVCTASQQQKCSKAKCTVADDGKGTAKCSGDDDDGGGDDEAPELTVCTPSQQKKCGSSTCAPANKRPSGVKCTDPDDPTVEVCTPEQQRKCGAKPCTMKGGNPSPCAGPPDLGVCTEAQQKKCGKNTCKVGAGGTPKCKTGEPDECTNLQKDDATCGQQQLCLTTGEGSTPECVDDVPDLFVCTPGDQQKCGTSACLATSRQERKCVPTGPPSPSPPPTPPGPPKDWYTCTEDDKKKCGPKTCVKTPFGGWLKTVTCFTAENAHVLTKALIRWCCVLARRYLLERAPHCALYTWFAHIHLVLMTSLRWDRSALPRRSNRFVCLHSCRPEEVWNGSVHSNRARSSLPEPRRPDGRSLQARAVLPRWHMHTDTRLHIRVHLRLPERRQRCAAVQRSELPT